MSVGLNNYTPKKRVKPFPIICVSVYSSKCYKAIFSCLTIQIMLKNNKYKFKHISDSINIDAYKWIIIFAVWKFCVMQSSTPRRGAVPEHEPTRYGQPASEFLVGLHWTGVHWIVWLFSIVELWCSETRYTQRCVYTG